MITCTDCGSELPDSLKDEQGDARTPCPNCGSTARTNHVTALDSVSSTTDAVLELDVTWGKDRPWQEQWRAVLRGLGDLQRAYTGWPDGPADSDGWKQLPIEFCEDCYHLKDWLQGDPPGRISCA
jgi:hypothetical protein